MNDRTLTEARLYRYDTKKCPPTFEKFCCGLSLKTGVKTVAVYQTVMQLILFGLKVKPLYEAFSSKLTTPSIVNLVESISCCTIYVVEFVMALVLIVGISKGVMSNLRLWLKVECVIEACHVIEVAALLIALLLQYQATSLTEEVLDAVIDIFCLLVVYSYYVEQTTPKSLLEKQFPCGLYKSKLHT